MLSHVRLFVTPWTATRLAPLSFTISWSLLKLMSIELVMPSNHLIFCCPFSSCPQSFPASGSFPTSRLFSSGGQSTGASASASGLPVNIQTQGLSPGLPHCRQTLYHLTHQGSLDICVNTSKIRKLNSSITTKSPSCSLYSHTLLRASNPGVH